MTEIEVFKNPYVLYPCICLAAWDAITTGLGTLSILGSDAPGSYVAAFIVTAFVAAIMMNSTKILESRAEVRDLPEFSHFFLTVLVAVVVIYDFYTSFHGARFVTTDPSANSGGFGRWFVIFLLTILSVGSTVICSWVYQDRQRSS
jgi:hypothetical protein